MAGKGFRLRWQPTSSSGSVSETMDADTWPQVVHGSVKLNHVFLKASKLTTTFDFKITSPTGNVIFQRIGNVAELNEGKELVMFGEYTLTIENVTNGADKVDDTFEGEFMFQELKNK